MKTEAMAPYINTGLLFLLMYIFFFDTLDCKSLGNGKSYDGNSLLEPVKYLKKYGYLSAEFNTNNFGTDKQIQLEKAVKLLQREAQLPMSGDLDEMTREVMTWPRCGNKEVYNKQRKKRYALFGTKLVNKNVSYDIIANNYTQDLPRELVDTIFGRAVGFWSEVADLNFIRTNENPVMRITFAEGYHNDGAENTFDGKGNTLAHGFFPGEESVELASDIHFDDAEDWIYTSDEAVEGVALLQVATHEIGHALGLRHSNVKDAVMSAFYPGVKIDFSLHSDDIKGIQVLYGSKSTQHDRLQQLNSVSHCALNYCNCGHITAITKSVEFNSYFAFSGNYVLKLTYNQVAQGYPRMTSSEFPEFSGHVDAVHTLFIGELRTRIYLFQGNVTYVYNLDSRGAATYVKHGKTENIIYGVRGRVTTVVEYGKDKNVYLFTGDSYYRLIQYRNGLYADWHYPQSTSKWHFPSSESPDAGLRAYDGRTYFFFGNSFMEYNETREQKFSAARNVRRVLFGCSNSHHVQNENMVQDNQQMSPLSQDAGDTYSKTSACARNYSDLDRHLLFVILIILKTFFSLTNTFPRIGLV